MTAELPNFFQSDWWLVVSLAVVVSYILLRLMMGKKDPLDKPSGHATLAQQRSVDKQTQNVLEELAELARQISNQLDTRAARLELLIKQADEKIAQLKGLPVGKAAAQDQPSPPAQADARYVEIYRLSDSGQSTVQIAQQLNRPQGEIELILALRPRT